MAIACTPQALQDLAGCFNCLLPGQQLTLQTYLLGQILAEQTGTPFDLAASVAASSCFNCLTPGQQLMLQTYFLCQIADALTA